MRSYDFISSANITDEINIRKDSVWDGLVESEKLQVVRKIEKGEEVTTLNYTTWQDVKLLYSERISQKDLEIGILTEEKTNLQEASK